MKKILRSTVNLLTVFSLGLSAFGLCLAQNGKIDNIAEQASSVTEFDVNGLKVLVKRRPSTPTVAAGLFLRGGVRNIDAKNAGIENLMLNTAIEGGKKFPRQTLRRELAATGSVIGASAAYDLSAVSLVSTRQNFDRAWDMFTDVIMNPVFSPDDIDREKQQILTGLRSADDQPDSALQNFQNRIIYAGHPYSNDPDGTIANIQSFTAADLAAYHGKAMQTSRLLLVVVGDVDPDQLKARVTASLGKLTRGDYKETPLPALDFSKPTLDIATRAIPTNYIEGVFSAPPLNSPDYYAMRVATTILRDRIFEEVRVKRNLSYAPDASMANLAANTGNIYVTAVDANQAVSVMLNQVRVLQTQLVDSDQISGSAGMFLTTFYVGQETNAAQAGELAKYELFGGGWRNSFEFLNRIREVRPEDIRTVANKYIKNIRFVVIGNPAAVNRSVFIPAE